MTKVLVVHGAGMNMRGKAQMDVFGPQTLEDYNRQIREYAAQVGVEVAIFHSNLEGETLNAFYAAHDGDVDAAIINPAGFTSGAPSLVSGISQVRFPTIEVHITNPAARGTHSVFSPVCRGSIVGFGLFGYYLALLAAKHIVERR
ncbi:MAG: type II 3-dehydroquinate dehydratase [Chloroflexi bacterium]|nr:type II 3-dehydroquinate dehydratase [Chloroflexota bacterium]